MGYTLQRRLNEAIRVLTEALALRREIFKVKHPDIIESMEELVTRFHTPGRYKKAGYREGTQQEILGDKHPDTIEGIAELAKTYYTLGRHKAVEERKVEVVALHREVLGNKYLNTIESIASLAAVHCASGSNEDAGKLVSG